jgi:hypothetical protein
MTKNSRLTHNFLPKYNTFIFNSSGKLRVHQIPNSMICLLAFSSPQGTDCSPRRTLNCIFNYQQKIAIFLTTAIILSLIVVLALILTIHLRKKQRSKIL